YHFARHPSSPAESGRYTTEKVSANSVFCGGIMAARSMLLDQSDPAEIAGYALRAARFRRNGKCLSLVYQRRSADRAKSGPQGIRRRSGVPPPVPVGSRFRPARPGLAVPSVRALAAVSVETLRPVETKHAICVRSFHRMRSFHVVAAGGTAAPRKR